MSHDPILQRRRRSRLARTIVRSADKKAPVDLSKVAAQRDCLVTMTAKVPRTFLALSTLRACSLLTRSYAKNFFLFPLSFSNYLRQLLNLVEPDYITCL